MSYCTKHSYTTFQMCQDTEPCPYCRVSQLTIALEAERKNVVYAQQKWGEAEERAEKWKAWYESLSASCVKNIEAPEQI